MQGLWKENISGWNHKDSYRKLTKRKHNIKYKGRYYLKEFDKYSNRSHNNLKYNTELEVVVETKQKEVYTQAKVYNALIKYPDTYTDIRDNMGNLLYSTTQHKTVNCLVYSFEHPEYKIRSLTRNGSESSYLIYEDFGKDLPISAWLSSYEIIQFTETGIVKDYSEIKFNKTYFRKVGKPYRRFSSYNENMFLFGKPVTWKSDLNKLYNDGKRRKIGQDIVNGSDKTNLRNWLSKSDWDTEIKTHGYSKSLARFVS